MTDREDDRSRPERPADTCENDPFAVDRPERQFSNGTVEYVGETVFALRPDQSADLASVVSTTLDSDRYVAGDWFDLPATVYLVHDTATGDVCRVAVRAGRIELHALPDTTRETLAALRDRLANVAETTLTVDPIATPD